MPPAKIYDYLFLRFSGSISFHLRFHAANPGTPPGGGQFCAGDLSGERPSTLARLKTWKVLHLPAALNSYDEGQPGNYDFWATYTPLFVERVDCDLLQGSGIYFPVYPLASRHLVFEKSAPF
jgi:hypothetical protein